MFNGGALYRWRETAEDETGEHPIQIRSSWGISSGSHVLPIPCPLLLLNVLLQTSVAHHVRVNRVTSWAEYPKEIETSRLSWSNIWQPNLSSSSQRSWSLLGFDLNSPLRQTVTHPHLYSPRHTSTGYLWVYPLRGQRLMSRRWLCNFLLTIFACPRVCL